MGLSATALLNPGPPPQRSAPAQLNPGPPPPPPPQHSAPALLNPAHVYQAPVHSAPALLNPAPNQVHQNPMTVPRGGTDAQSSGPGYGSAQANAYKQSASYRLAIVQTFLHQPDPQKSAILKGAVYNPSYEGSLVLNFLHQRVPSDLFIPLLSKYGVDVKAKGLLDSKLGTELQASDLIPGAKYGGSGGGTGGVGSGLLGSVVPFASGSLGQKAVVNTGKDIVNTPAEAFSTAGILGGDVISGNFKKFGSDLLAQPKQFIKHPGSTFINHPFNTGLMLSGVADPLLRGGQAAVRAVGGKGPIDLTRPSVDLTGNLTHEQPPYSANPAIRGVQKANAQRLYGGDAPHGIVVPRTQGLRERLIRRNVSDQVGVNERIRSADIGNQKIAHAQSVLASRPARVAKAATNVVKYNPKAAFIPGANVLAHIAEGTIRRPETLRVDLAKRIASVAAARPSLLEFPKALAEHDAYMKELRSAYNNKALMRNPTAAFRASDKYAKDYAVLQAEAHATTDHFGNMTAEALQRRVLEPIVASHMPGARLDPKLGMVRDVPGSKHPQPISTAEMQKFADKQTGGRRLAYTSHQAPRGDSAFYTSGQQFPSKAVMGNTLYAYHHGLTDPSHEALLQARAHLANVINAHRSMNRNLSLFTVAHPGGHGRGWDSHAAAAKDAPGYAAARGENPSAGSKAAYVPIYVGRMHRPADMPAPGKSPLPAHLEEEAVRHSLDLNGRLQPSSDLKGNWNLVHHTVVDQLRQHENQISPNAFLRSARAITTQFRKVALGTSVRHNPGVALESGVRLGVNRVGPRSWVAGKRGFAELAKTDPRLAMEREIQLTGNSVFSMVKSGAPRQVSRHFAGTRLEPALRANEKFMAAPGIHTLANAWRGWTHVMINGVEHALSHNVQTAGVGKQLLRDRGKEGSLLFDMKNMMGLQGKALESAGNKLAQDRYVKQLYAGQQRMWGRWTDQTPSVQTALMFSPFGMWWANSVKWLARLPVDHPMTSGLMAMANVGTEQQRQALGLDMFSPHHLPLYEQGGIPMPGGKVWAANYYSPFGTVNDPLQTAQSLIQPTVAPLVLGAMGDNYQGKALTSPKDPGGRKPANPGEAGQVILNSILGLMVPLYTKAQTVAEGGAKSYDTSSLLFGIHTKGLNPGPAAGLTKATSLMKLYKGTSGQASSTGSGWSVAPTQPTQSSAGGSSGGGAWTPAP